MISLAVGSSWQRSKDVMGCRPSKNARTKVRDFKLKHRTSKRTWTNFDFSPISDGFNHPGFSDGISRVVTQRKFTDTSKVVFNKFSTTTKTYHNFDSKVATITLRLSTDGSTLQVETLEIDIDNFEDPSPLMQLKRSESAPALLRIKPICVRDPGAFLESKECIVTLHNENNREENVDKLHNINIDLKIDPSCIKEDNHSINHSKEHAREIMKSFNQGSILCAKTSHKSSTDCQLDTKPLFSEINADIRHRETKFVNHSKNTEFSHLENGDDNGNCSSEEKIDITEQKVNRKCCDEGRRKPMFDLENQFKVCDITDLDTFGTCALSKSHIQRRSNPICSDNIVMKQLFLKSNNNSRRITHSFHDGIDYIKCNERNGKDNRIKPLFEFGDAEIDGDTTDKSKLEDYDNVYCQHKPPLASFYDEFHDALEDEDNFVDSSEYLS